MRLLLALFLLCLSALPGRTEEVVLGLSTDKVAITTSFNGSEILIFGAIKRETPIKDEPLEIVITVAGPSDPVLVRRKAHRYGMWINTDAVMVDAAPSFYAVATTGPLRQVLSQTEDLRHKISIERAIRSVGAPDNIRDSARFTDALIRIRDDHGLYQELEGTVAFDQQTLFRTAIDMPADLTEGDYSTRIFLTRGGAVVSQYETVINVRKVGLERWLYVLSRQHAVLYGLLSLTIAIVAGWGASAGFSLLRNR
ncbi:TIGR02186 family protein [Pseudodonghicola xiamenensis]|uniref:Membrane protein n=1 Tax=Pseudodonghicola xiamenensis TaxID=337702 RepID=A0A8J3H7T7_9RHOB|nr:TIGR02186 family protein [Pseudodonghicola xiamenensis]GHG88629.1 membrane protein [Pseudodonghicola xiamenensis]